ncbi:MAG: arginase family protein, partial [Candidatus Methanomethylophilus sp.]|nr:arginase family protein [Methanomethylophilus sp.]
DFILPEDMLEEVKFAVGPTIRDGKFPIVIGGEHSGTIPVIQSYKERSIALMTIDAHLDSRDEYMGTPNSHACVTRRAADVHGLDNVCAVGVRSIGREELDREDVVPHVTAFEIFDHGIEWGVKKALDGLKADKVYLSIDIDGIDPAYAPGTGTPEPFGLLPIQVKKAINIVGDRLAGFDVMEICPPADHSGITAILGARLINEALAVLGKNLRQ